MNDHMHQMPALAAKKIKAGPPRICNLRTGCAMGLHASTSNVRTAPAGDAGNCKCAGSLAAEIIGNSAKDWGVTA